MTLLGTSTRTQCRSLYTTTRRRTRTAARGVCRTRASVRDASTTQQHRRDTLLWLSMATILPQMGHEESALAVAGETAYDFSLSYNGEAFPLSYLKNKVTVFVNVASE